MQAVSRLLFIVVLLASLAYASYAFGKYVLSAKLFDDEVVPKPSSGLRAVSQSTKVAETITRQNNHKGRTPRVQVKVLSVEDTGPGPEPPALSTDGDSTPQSRRRSTLDNSSDEGSSSDGSRTSSDTDRVMARITPPPTAKPLGHRSFDTGRISEGDGDGDDETPRRRRRKRRRRSTESTTGTVTVQRASESNSSDSSSTDSSSTARTEGDSSSGSSRSSSSSGSESSSRERAPARRRRTPSSERRRTRSESPIPRPEGSSSGGSDSSSPIPQPE